MSHWKSHMRNICRIANTNYSNSLVKIMMVGSYKLSFFVCVIRGQIARWFVRRAKTIFADNFSAAEIILLAKDGQAKIAVGNFSVRCSRRFFRGHFCGPKKQWIFWTVKVKKGVQPIALGRSVFLCTSRSDVKGAKTLLFGKSNRNAPLYPDFGLWFLRLFLIDNIDAG